MNQRTAEELAALYGATQPINPDSGDPIEAEKQRIRERSSASVADAPSNLVLVDFTRGRRDAVEGDL